jgi:uncharacterized protein
MEYSHLALIVLALGAGAIAKGATGMGLPLIAIPVLASYLGLPHAVSVMLIPIIATNSWQAWRFRNEGRAADLRFLLPMCIAGSVGMVLGTYALAELDERSLMLLLGLVLLCYVGFRLIQPDFVLGPTLGYRIAAPAGLAAGVLQGAAGLSSPAVITFIHAMRLPYRPHVFAVSVIFLVLGLVQLPSLAVNGILQWRWVAEGVFALLPALLFMPVGQRIGAAISKKAFDRLMLGFIGLMGLKMLLGI